ncbi:MAG: YbjN domain-containing protein [Kofleriaceae bacterium]|nr:YbjN domain-containing protein [Kofleriaceae bacterium]
MSSKQAEPQAPLFANQREANMESTIAMIEDILINLGHIVEDCRTDDFAQTPSWRVRKGSAWTRIELRKGKHSYRVRVVATVVSLSASVDRLALYEKLLQLNSSHVSGAAFALDDNQILLTSERSTMDLDRSELWDLISAVRDLADEYDDKLVSQFEGVSRAPDATAAGTKES